MHEQPHVERKRDELVINLAAYQAELQDIRSNILKNLAESSEETILDNVELIEMLEISQLKARQINEKIEEAKQVEVTINEARDVYHDVSIRGSILYFVIMDCGGIDPMYQYSLAYVKKLFKEALRATHHCPHVAQRIQMLIDTITRTIYTNICRGLFELSLIHI